MMNTYKLLCLIVLGCLEIVFIVTMQDIVVYHKAYKIKHLLLRHLNISTTCLTGNLSNALCISQVVIVVGRGLLDSLYRDVKSYILFLASFRK